MTNSNPTHGTFNLSGHTFTIRVTVPRARVIRDTLDVDLLAVADQSQTNPFVKMADNPELFGDVLWALCQERAAAVSLDKDAFLDAFDDQSIDAASDALIEATINAFPKKKRTMLQAVKRAQDDALDRVAEKLTPQRLAKIVDAEVDAAVEKALQTPGTSSTS